MLRNILALLGLFIFIFGLASLTVEFSQQQAVMPGRYDTGALITAGIGLLLGPLLTIPWWRRRLQEEEKWFEKRNEPIEGPPRIST